MTDNTPISVPELQLRADSEPLKKYHPGVAATMRRAAAALSRAQDRNLIAEAICEQRFRSRGIPLYRMSALDVQVCLPMADAVIAAITTPAPTGR